MRMKFTRTQRCYLIDHHFPQSVDIPLDKLDLEEYRNFYRQAEVDSVMVYFKDHWGLSYYPSKVENAEMKAGISPTWMHDYVNMLKEENYEVVAYYCIEYDEGAARKNTEWRALDINGKPLRRIDKFAKWSICCYESSYREYCLAQLEEIISTYQPDALFLDIFGASLCFCESCQKKYRKLFNRPYPKTPAEVTERHEELLHFLNIRAKNFMQDVKAVLNRQKDRPALTINFSCHYPELIKQDLDYQFSEPILKNNWLSAAYARDTAEGQYPIVAPGELSNVYNYKSSNSYIADLSSIAAQNCRVGMYSGSQRVDGSLEIKEAERIGAAYKEIKKMEQFFVDREPLASIVILQSDKSTASSQKNFQPDAILRAKEHNPHLKAILGAMQICEYVKIPYRLVSEQAFLDFDFSSSQLLILPEIYSCAPEIKEKILQLSRQGLSIVSSPGSTKTFSSAELIELFAVEAAIENLANPHNDWKAYICSVADSIAYELLRSSYAAVSNYYEIKGLQDTAQVLAKFTLPSLSITEKTWVNWWSAPPACTNPKFLPAIIANKDIKAPKTNYLFAYNIFAMVASSDFNGLEEFFHDVCLNEIDFPIRQNVACTSIIKTAFYKRHNRIQLHLLSDLPIQYNGEKNPVNSGQLELRNLARVKSARQVYPSILELDWAENSGVTLITLPNIEIQSLVEIDFYES